MDLSDLIALAIFTVPKIFLAFLVLLSVLFTIRTFLEKASIIRTACLSLMPLIPFYMCLESWGLLDRSEYLLTLISDPSWIPKFDISLVSVSSLNFLILMILGIIRKLQPAKCEQPPIHYPTLNSAPGEPPAHKSFGRNNYYNTGNNPNPQNSYLTEQNHPG